MTDIRTVPGGAPWHWLAEGWEDILRSRSTSLVWGALFAGVGLVILLLLVLRGLAFSAASGIKANETMAVFLYVIPLAAILYSGYYLYQNRTVGIPRRLQPHVERASLATEAWMRQQHQRYLDWRRRTSEAAA